VTGKLDVREAAAGLPEADPLAAEDTLNDTLDVDAVPGRPTDRPYPWSKIHRMNQYPAERSRP